MPNMQRTHKAIPTELFTGRKMDAKNKLKLKFGDYMQAFDKYVVSEKKEERTRSAIALGPEGNSSGRGNSFR